MSIMEREGLPDLVAPGGEAFERVLARRVSRREALRVGLITSAATAVAPLLRSAPARAAGRPGPSFTPISPELDDAVNVAPGFRADVLIRWGDPMFPGVPAFDLAGQTPARQEKRFGFNCDYVMYFPLPPGSRNPNRGLLFVNHEYTDGLMMFPGYDPASPTREQVEIELAAHGASVVEVVAEPGHGWRYRRDGLGTGASPRLLPCG